VSDFGGGDLREEEKIREDCRILVKALCAR